MNKEEVYELIDKHFRVNYTRLVKGFSSNSGSKHNAEDVVQGAYSRACEYWQSFDVEKDFEKWFNQILNNSLRDKINEERHHGGTTEFQTAADDAVPPAGMSKVLLEQVSAFIQEQPEQFRKIYILYFLLQYRSKDIEKLVRQKANHIDQIVFHFRKELRKKFSHKVFK